MKSIILSIILVLAYSCENYKVASDDNLLNPADKIKVDSKLENDVVNLRQNILKLKENKVVNNLDAKSKVDYFKRHDDLFINFNLLVEKLSDDLSVSEKKDVEVQYKKTKGIYDGLIKKYRL